MNKVFIFLCLFLQVNIMCLKDGDIEYVTLDQLIPGQLTYSSKNVIQKIKENLSGTKIDFDKNFSFCVMDNIKFKFDNGRSIFPLQKAAPVFKIKDKNGKIKYVICDKHHHILALVAIAQSNSNLPVFFAPEFAINQTQIDNLTKFSMPIHVKKDFTKKSESQFWQYAEQNYLVDLVNSRGEKSLPVDSLLKMENYPMRSFVTDAALKFSGMNIKSAFGCSYPLWIKILSGNGYGGDKINHMMIENNIAHILAQHGFEYNFSDSLDKVILHKKIDDARKILINFKKQNPKNILLKHLRLVEKPVTSDQILKSKTLQKLMLKSDTL